MLFNSLDFVVFFPLVVALYFALPHRWRWGFLLAASYYFYACWKVEYLGLIVVSTLVDYWAGLQMGKHAERRGRRPFLLLSLASNLGILFAFKYFNFFNESARAVFDRFDLFYGVPAFDVLLPVGISFYTFQTLAYSIDVYRGKKEPETHLGIFALYVSFFPQLVAGPIERSQHLLPQFRQTYGFDAARVADGLKLMAWGFFKKLVIADRLAVYVDAVYNDPTAHTGLPVILATYFFAFQIYCDFSGYSDIAIGTAKVMGYDLMDNFRRPYFAKSIAEFWRRWHISLSTWFRDYLYIPLGGNRVARWRWYVNLFLVFLISGLWHGANWTFVVWGGLHGLYLVVGVMTAARRERIWGTVSALTGRPVARVGAEAPGGEASGAEGVADEAPVRAGGLAPRVRAEAVQRWVRVVITFHLVLLAWVFFRANDVGDALVLLGNAFDFSRGLGSATAEGALSRFELGLALVSIFVLEGVHLLERRANIREVLRRRPAYVRYPVYAAVVLAILLFGEFGAQQFIYFQF